MLLAPSLTAIIIKKLKIILQMFNSTIPDFVSAYRFSLVSSYFRIEYKNPFPTITIKIERSEKVTTNICSWDGVCATQVIVIL